MHRVENGENGAIEGKTGIYLKKTNNQLCWMLLWKRLRWGHRRIHSVFATLGNFDELKKQLYLMVEEWKEDKEAEITLTDNFFEFCENTSREMN